MRKWFVVPLLLVVAASVASKGKADAAAKSPTAESILEMCGGRLAKVFTVFGVPEEVYASRSSKAELDTAVLDYGGYCFQVRDKTVRTCLFTSEWKGSVKGVKIGDSRDQVDRALGTERKTAKSSIDVEDYGYTIKDLDATMWTDFDVKDHVRMIEIQLN